MSYRPLALRLSHLPSSPATRLILIRTMTTTVKPRSTPTTIKPPLCISDVIKQDHRELEDYYANILNADDSDTRARWANKFVWELARHSIGEELVVYPVLKKILEGGNAMANRDREEHNKIKIMLGKFQRLAPTNSEFEPLLKQIMSSLSQHIKEEEDQDLVKLEHELSLDDSADLADSFQRTKHFVPTRAHTSIPNKPPFDTVASLLAAPIDKLGDMFRRFPHT